MRPLPVLTPHGSAREAFACTDLGASAVMQPAWEFPGRLKLEEVAYGLGEETLYAAWEIARHAEALDASERRAFYYLVLAVFVAAAEGSTRLPVAGAEAAYVEQLFGRFGVEELAATARELAGDDRVRGLIGAPGEPKPLVRDGNYIYEERLHRLEGRLAEALGRRFGVASARAAGVDAAVARVAAHPAVVGGAEVRLIEEQLAAVRAAAASRFCLVTGGPGTGKTSIVVAILRTLVRLGVDPGSIGLAAPTGKAAKRMRESIDLALQSLPVAEEADERLRAAPPEAKTIHRLLRYSIATRSFRHHRRNQLPHEVLIVDEGSMIDVPLMERLVNAVADEAILVLLGDGNQLPSVGAGEVFRDLVGSTAASLLTKSHRADERDRRGAHILDVAAAVNEGNSARVLALIGSAREPASEVEFGGVEQVGVEERAALLERWFDTKMVTDAYLDLCRRTYTFSDDGLADEDRAHLGELFAHLGTTRVLTLTRETAGTGAERINEQLRRALFEKQQRARAETTRDPGAAGLFDLRRFGAGVPVMVQKNDYDLNLFNGDQGVVLWVRRPGQRPRLQAVFPSGESFVAHAPGALGHRLKACFAMTVHKAQGSEYGGVVLVLPEKANPLCTRELVYTAITRAKTSAVVVGAPNILETCVEEKVERFCGVAEKLVGPPPGG